MGTQLQRLALLLAVLQYAAVQAEDYCWRAENPSSKCAAGLDATRIACKELSGADLPRKSCSSGQHKFIRIRDAGPWRRVKDVVCQEKPPLWKITMHDNDDDVTERKLSSTDNMVCANIPPDSGDCGWCLEPELAECDPSTGCVAGGAFVTVTGPAAPYCKQLKCPEGERFEAEISYGDPALPAMIEEIRCNPGKWWGVAGTHIYKAICVKKVSCSKLGLLKSDCTGLENKYGECKTLDLSKDAHDVKLACRSDDKMYFKGAAPGSEWKLASDVKCDQIKGTWSHGEETVIANDNVICSRYEMRSCIADNGLTSICDPAIIDPTALSQCKTVTFVDDKALACDGTLYTHTAGKWRAREKVQCNREDGVFEGAGSNDMIDAGTNVICSSVHPSGPCECATPLPAPKFDCAAVPGCVKTNMENRDTPAAVGCKDKRCHNDGFFVVDSTIGKPAFDKIVCDTDTGVWKGQDSAGAKHSFQDAVCVQTILCPTASIKSTCPAGDSNCQSIPAAFFERQFADGDFFNCYGDLHAYMQKQDGAWSNKVAHCDTYTGAWMDGDTKMSGTANIICTPNDPRLPSVCPAVVVGDCAAVTAAVAAAAGANAAAKVATLGCLQPVLPYPRSAASQVTCPDRSTLYLKPKGQPRFQVVTSLTCEADGKWLLRFPFEDNREINSDEYMFICLKSNPDDKVCQIAGGDGVIPDPHKESFTPSVEMSTASDAKEHFQVGEPARCEGRLDETLSEVNANVPDRYLVCSQDGKWRLGDEDFGHKIVCATRKCRQCNVIPSDLRLGAIGDMMTPEISYHAKPVCLQLECDRENNYTNNKLIVKYKDDNSGMISNHNDVITCVFGGEWTASGRVVESAGCAKHLHCLSSTDAHPGPLNFAQVKLDCPTSGVEGCVAAERSGGGANVPHDRLSCPLSKKLLIGPTDKDWYDEVRFLIKCDTERGLWVGENRDNNDAAETWDHKHRVICADRNPNPRPTTTTTTTTPAPLEPICSLCEKHLPKLIDCKTCSPKMTYAAENRDNCVMKPERGYDLIIGEENRIVRELYCVRDRNPYWRTIGDHEVTSFNGRKKQRDEIDWKDEEDNEKEETERDEGKGDTSKGDGNTVSCVIIGIVVAAIGGIGMG